MRIGNKPGTREHRDKAKVAGRLALLLDDRHVGALPALRTGPFSTHCSSKHSPQPCSGPASKKELEVDSAPTVQ